MSIRCCGARFSTSRSAKSRLRGEHPRRQGRKQPGGAATAPNAEPAVNGRFVIYAYLSI
jgi:hypothetical protein